jgi:hypothetical protein
MGTLVYYQGKWATKLSQNILVNKLGSDNYDIGLQNLCFDPLSSIINSD